MIEISSLEFDDRNRHHLRERARLDEMIIIEVWTGTPVFAENPPADGRSGSHLMIGPDLLGRLWTIVLVCVDEEEKVWRPITGWQTTRTKEVQLWRDAT